MKEFYAQAPASVPFPVASLPCRARVAVYDAPSATPRVVDVGPASPGEFIEALSVRVHELVCAAGGSIPYTVIRELSENLIHADFREPVISILDGGSTLRFADQGPGIQDRERAVQPGFTTATGEMKRLIRGVGSGLPIVKEFLSCAGGRLSIEDNLGAGAVVTVSSRSAVPRSTATVARAPHDDVLPVPEEPSHLFAPPAPTLSTRQKQVLAVVLEAGTAGPSIVSRELGVGLSTAHRDLATLEDLGLIAAEDGKRYVTQSGKAYLGDPGDPVRDR